MPGVGALADLLAAGVIFWIALLCLTVLAKVLRHRISLQGLLRKANGDRIEIARLQLALASFGGVAVYLGSIVTSLHQPGSLPEPPDWLLVAIGGSNAVYLGGKTLPQAMFFLSRLRGQK